MVNVRPFSKLKPLLYGSVVVGASFSAPITTAAGLDSGYDVARTAAVFDEMQPSQTNGGWIRIRGLENCAVGPQSDEALRQTRAALVGLRAKGANVAAIVRWPTLSWSQGARQPAREGRLPINLWEAFDRCRQLAETFGDVVDMWEIDNEPDISFVQENPETYAAFLKACYLGFARGTDDRGQRTEVGPDAEKLKSDEPVPSGQGRSQPSARYSLPATRYTSRVLMAPLALPPGPYLEAFVANGGLSYTDGFNYHYYGYAEDFTGVYRQFQEAVRELASANAGRQGTEDRRRTTEPVRPRSAHSTPSTPFDRLRAGGSGQAAQGHAARETEDGGRRTEGGRPTTEDGGRRTEDGRRRSEGGPTSVSVFRTKFFPSAQGWKGTVVAKFDHAPSEIQTAIEQVLGRPRAAEEPPLKQQGRWLVTDGVKVEEIPGGWRFTVEKWPDGPLRAPMAELPLPKGWPLVEKADVARSAEMADAEGVGPSAARVDRDGAPIGPARSQGLKAEGLKAEDGGRRTDDRGKKGDRLPPEQVALRESLISYEYRIVKDPSVTTVKASDAIDPERQRRQVWNVSSLPAYAEPVRRVEGHDEPEVETATEERPTSNTQHPTSSAGQYEAPASGQPTSGRKAENGGQRTDDTTKTASVSLVPLEQAALRQPNGLNTQLIDLPVFLTEYGYGSLDKVTRNTAEGKERQRLWFSDVGEQIRALRIEGAMAFVLMPYLEGDLLEFGLLTESPIGSTTKHTKDTKGEARRVGDFYASPALEEMLTEAAEPITPRRWRVETPPPSPIVIDFIAGKGLGQAKSYGGYFLEGEYGRATPGEGDLVVCNFDDQPVTGELRIEGDAWELKQEEGSATKNAKNTMRLRLQPMERRLVQVLVRPKTDRFAACPVSARFVEVEEGRGRMTDPVRQAQGHAARETEDGGRTGDPNTENLKDEKLKSRKPEDGQRQALPETPKPPFNMFECYFRTENGNLYQTWPRLLPRQSWQRYMEPVENFTMAFYGRAKLPWRFTENRPTSLVFYFHCDEFPATYEIRGAQIISYSSHK